LRADRFVERRFAAAAIRVRRAGKHERAAECGGGLQKLTPGKFHNDSSWYVGDFLYSEIIKRARAHLKQTHTHFYACDYSLRACD
jgi:hypothetical protein